MEYRSLGSSGLRVSLAGLGCNAFGVRIDEDRSREVIHAALEAGITFFDTAPIYGRSEEFMGRALKGRRDEIVLATKFGYAGTTTAHGGSRSEIARSVEVSLRALDTDHLDLLQLHRPDPLTPIEETLRALSAVVEQGKVRYIGCSNFTAWMLAEAHWTARTSSLEPFVSAQNPWNMLNRALEAEMVPACERYGCGVLPFYPLASGLLTGKVRRDQPPQAGTKLADPYHAATLSDANFTKVEALEAWGAEHDRTLPEIALSWMASQPVVSSVIAGATSADQVKANVAATRTDLTPSDLAELDAALGG